MTRNVVSGNFGDAVGDLLRMKPPPDPTAKASRSGRWEEALRRIIASVLGLVLSALIYTELGLMIAVGVMAVLFIALSLNGPKDTRNGGRVD
jgi:hypothetical protein